MMRVIIAWAFGAAFFNIVSGPVYVAFARQIGANDFILGVLGAALPAMSFLQVVAARVLERSGQPKRQMLIGGLIGRSLWVVAALAPLISLRFPHIIPRDWVLNIVIGSVVLSGVFQAFTGPAFFTWMSELVPSRVRPAFLARRMQMGTLGSLSVILLASYFADNYPTLAVYATILTIGAIAGVLDIAFFFGVKQPPSVPAPQSEMPPLIASLLEPLRDRAVRNFLGFVSLLGISYGTMAPFIAVHSLEFLGLSKMQTSLLTNVAPLVGITLTSRFWGELIRRYGNRPIMRMSSLCLVVVPVLWMLTTPATWYLLAPTLFLSGMMFCSIELANQNLITSLSPHIPRGTVTAVVSIFGGLSFAIGAVAAGRVAYSLEGQEWKIGAFTFVSYHALFLMSFVARAINAFFIAPSLQEPTSTSTRNALRETWREFVVNRAHSSTRRSVQMPLLSKSRRASRKKRNLRAMKRGNRR